MSEQRSSEHTQSLSAVASDALNWCFNPGWSTAQCQAFFHHRYRPARAHYSMVQCVWERWDGTFSSTRAQRRYWRRFNADSAALESPTIHILRVKENRKRTTRDVNALSLSRSVTHKKRDDCYYASLRSSAKNKRSYYLPSSVMSKQRKGQQLRTIAPFYEIGDRR